MKWGEWRCFKIFVDDVVKAETEVAQVADERKKKVNNRKGILDFIL